jgi:hypothetical protein
VISTIDLPVPPSVNRLGRTGRGRVYRSKRYTARSKVAGWEAHHRRGHRHDRGVLDLLVAHQVVAILRRATSVSDYSEDVTT